MNRRTFICAIASLAAPIPVPATLPLFVGVDFAYGGPLGASIGWAVGSCVGQWLDPPKDCA